ncbi:biological adhesion [Desmophyllum pertusum]|uniref:Biological adhesion n=1 Tax=Desmophyllum pertusum TaxID=174260 RepID=A0A9W9ZDT1_9CNID|nr:biological adhesion [Desmophyllum pertusum]
MLALIKPIFAIVTFAGKAKIRASLDEEKFQNQKGLNDLIDDMKVNDKLARPTRPDLALEAVNEVFSVGNGDRPDSRNVMIFFTDGGKHKESKPFSEVIPPLEEKGVDRVAVGIGRKIKQEELANIAGSPDRIVNAASFDELDEKLDLIRETTCSKFLFVCQSLDKYCTLASENCCYMRDNRVPLVLFGGTPGGGEGRRLGCGGGGTSSGGEWNTWSLGRSNTSCGREGLRPGDRGLGGTPGGTWMARTLENLHTYVMF